MAYAAPNTTHKVEPYTQMPNRYLDYISPMLSRTERDVAEIIIRYTKGYHKSSAAIPNRVFMSRTGRSEPTIIKAKKSLINMGLIIVLSDGGGATTTEYMIDLYYDNPSKSIKAQLNRQKAQLEELSSVEDEQQDIQDVIMAAPLLDNTNVQDTITTPSVHTSSSDVCTEKPLAVSNIDDSQESVTNTDICNITTDLSPSSIDDTPATITTVSNTEPNASIASPPPNNDVDAITNTPIDDECEAISDEYDVNGAASSTSTTITNGTVVISTKSNTHVTPESILTDPNTVSTTKVSIVLLNKDLRSIININKTNTDTNSNLVSKFGSNTTTIRCLFSTYFPESITSDDWGYFGYLVTTYGMRACRSKIDYMSEHRKSHTITNPKGFLRSALQFDYQMPKSILLKIKADESARLAGERTRRKSQEWRSRVSNFNYGNASTSLSKLIETLN